MRGRERERGCVCEMSASPSPGFGTKNIRYSFPRGRKGEKTSTEVDYLYPGKEVQQMSTERDQRVSIFIGRFVEAIREMLIRQVVLGIL